MGKIISNGVQYSGLMNVEGAFIDTDNVIYNGTFRGNVSYTAAEDCYVKFYLQPSSNQTLMVNVDNANIIAYGALSKYVGDIFPIKKGQTVEITGADSNLDAVIQVFGIQSGSNVIGEIKKLDDFITLSSGYTLNANSLIIKQGNFIFADIIIQKDSNFSTSQNVVGSVPSKYALVKNVQTYGVLSAQPYNKSNYNAYFLIDRNNNGQVEVWANDSGYPVVEVKFIAELS